MQNNAIDFDNVLEKVEQDSIGKADYITPLSNITMLSDGGLAFFKTQDVKGPQIRDLKFRTTDWAETQMFSKLGMPVKYFKRIKEKAPELVLNHFNHWASKSSNSVMLRTRIRDNGNPIIRGFVSDKYSIIDNDTVTETLDKIINQHLGNKNLYSIRMFHLDEKRLHIRLTFTKMSKNVGSTSIGMPDTLQVGVDIVNSEVGAASLSVSEMVWRLVCSNGLRVWDIKDAFSQRHIHLKQHEIYFRMVDGITNCIGGGANLLREYMKTMQVKVQNPFSIIDNISKSYGLTSEFADNAKTLWEGEETAYGIINSITAASRNLPNERRLDTERIAGRLVSLSPNQWEKLAIPEDNSRDKEGF